MKELKWVLNNRQTEEKNCIRVFDLKEERKKIGELWIRPEGWKPGNNLIVSFSALCFRRIKPESQSIEEFKAEIKRYFEQYLNSIQVK